MNRGVTLYIAVIILSASMAIAFGIADIYYGELRLSQGADKSYEAFYQANTGIECALYYDFHNPYPANPAATASYFDPLNYTAGPIVCGTASANPTYAFIGGKEVYTFSFDDTVKDLYFDVTVTKAGGDQIIDAIGRNICRACSGVRVERGIRSVID